MTFQNRKLTTLMKVIEHLRAQKKRGRNLLKESLCFEDVVAGFDQLQRELDVEIERFRKKLKGLSENEPE